MAHAQFARPPASWWAQYSALCQKHYLLAKRNWRTTALQLLMGAVITCMLIGFQALADTLLGFEIPHPLPEVIGPMPRCIALRHSIRANADGTSMAGCNTILYAPRSPDVDMLL